MKHMISVTDVDIRNGKTLSIWDCPLALAMRRVLGDESMVVTDYFRLPNGNTRPLPALAIDFRQSFDAGKTVSPFSFEVEV